MTDEADFGGLTAEFRGLRGEVVNVGDKLDEHQAAYDADKAAQVRRTRASQRKARVAIAVGVIGIGVGTYGVYGVHKINEERADRTITSCQQSAEKAVKDNAQDDVMIDMLTEIIGGSDNPATVGFLTPYVDRLNANKSKVRDCTPEGIRRYNDSHGADGFLP